MANGLSSLSSPLVVLGGLWWVGENRREFSGGMNGMDILAGGFGASSAQWAGGQVQSLLGADVLTDQLSQALAGAVVSNYGGMLPQNEAIARGIHLNVAQQAFSDASLAAGDLIGDLDLGNIGGGGGGGNSNSDSESQQQSASMTMNGSGGSQSASEFLGA